MGTENKENEEESANEEKENNETEETKDKVTIESENNRSLKVENTNEKENEEKTTNEEGLCFSHQNENKDGNHQESNSSVVQKVENCQGEQDTSSEGERNARKASFQQSNLSEDDEGNEADEEDEGEKEDEQEKKD